MAAAELCAVQLDWAPNESVEPASFSIYRSSTIEAMAKLIVDGLARTTYLDTAVRNGVTYMYTIAALDADGDELVESNEATATPISDSDSVSVQLAPSRSSGVAPLAVFFDATGTSARATTRTFHELHYRWDFGDPQSGRWSTDSSSKNEAIGAMAAHVFDRPGEYTVRVAVTDRDGNQGTCETVVVVDDADRVFAGERTICFANDPDDWSGAPEGARKVVTSSWSDVVSLAATQRRLLLRRGDSYQVTEKMTLNVGGPGTIGAFGVGARPRIVLTRSDLVALNPSRGDTRDWRIIDLEFEGNAAYASDAIDGRGQDLQHLLLYRLRFSNLGKAFETSTAAAGSEGSNDLFFVECEGAFVGMGNAPPPAPIRGGAFFTAGVRHAMLGCEWTHAVIGFPLAANGEFLCRWTMVQRLVCSHNRFRGANEGNNVLRVHGPPFDGSGGVPPGTYSEFILISDNEILDSSDTTPVKVGTAGNKDERLREFIFERNYVHSSPNSSRKAYFNVTRNLSIRNNVFDLGAGGTQRAVEVQRPNARAVPGEGPESVWLDNNTIYSDLEDADDATFVQVGDRCKNVHVRNNLLVVPRPHAIRGPRIVEDLTDGEVRTAGNLVAGAAGPAVGEIFVAAMPEEIADFRLREGSPAVDAGVPVALQDDFTRRPRPRGAGFDIGAYEAP